MSPTCSLCRTLGSGVTRYSRPASISQYHPWSTVGSIFSSSNRSGISGKSSWTAGRTCAGEALARSAKGWRVTRAYWLSWK